MKIALLLYLALQVGLSVYNLVCSEQRPQARVADLIIAGFFVSAMVWLWGAA
jgi:hypothetical protein